MHCGSWGVGKCPLNHLAYPQCGQLRSAIFQVAVGQNGFRRYCSPCFSFSKSQPSQQALHVVQSARPDVLFLRCGMGGLVRPFGVANIDMHTPTPPRAPHQHPHRFASKHFEHLPTAYGHPLQYHHKWQNCQEEGAGWWDAEERVIFTTFRSTTRRARILNPSCTPFGHCRPWVHPHKKFQGNWARFWLS